MSTTWLDSHLRCGVVPDSIDEGGPTDIYEQFPDLRESHERASEAYVLGVMPSGLTHDSAVWLLSTVARLEGLNARREVSVPRGRIDLVVSAEAADITWFIEWKSSLSKTSQVVAGTRQLDRYRTNSKNRVDRLVLSGYGTIDGHSGLDYSAPEGWRCHVDVLSPESLLSELRLLGQQHVVDGAA